MDGTYEIVPLPPKEPEDSIGSVKTPLIKRWKKKKKKRWSKTLVMRLGEERLLIIYSLVNVEELVTEVK